MGDMLRPIYTSKIIGARIVSNRKEPSKCYLVASSAKHFTDEAWKCVASMKRSVQTSGVAGDAVVFLITTAALEVVRRLSKERCTFTWRGLQALQVLCFPPFKWIQRWTPLNVLIKQLQRLSRPMLFLSIATAFSDRSSSEGGKTANDNHNFRPYSESQVNTSPEQGNPQSSSPNEVQDACHPEEWLLELHKELSKEGVSIPERLNDDELRQFYAAANCDFMRFLSSVKKTIEWRQSYTILSPEEIEAWSHLVFWHGHDVNQRPCLIIRLGLACSNLKSNDRPFFVKAVVSQIEHGILRLVGVEHPQITVLMDCGGLSPFGFPIHMMRSCAMLLQDHYPNRLSCLIIVRLPQLAQVIMQTLFQVLKPGTRQKVRIIGRKDQVFLSKYLHSIPSFLGGNCSCSECLVPSTTRGKTEEAAWMEPTAANVNDKSPELHLHISSNMNGNRKVLIKTMIIGILMVCVFIALIVVKHYPERLPLLHWQHKS